MSEVEMRALLARVEAATGSDREIDQDLFCDLGLCQSGEDGRLNAYRAPGYTASLDAAVALVERTLPECEWLVRSADGQGAFANLHVRGQSPNEDHPCWPAQGKTAALALCAALLKALAARSNPAHGDDAGGIAGEAGRC